jgi:predicted cation transporter
MSHIPDEPVLYIVLGLSVIAILILILPVLIKKVEENLQLFFLLMGIIAVTISGLWSWGLVVEALKAPVVIGSIPIGIFQVVLIFSLVIHYSYHSFSKNILSIVTKLGWRLFAFLSIFIMGLLCSLISVIVAAVLLAEILAALPLEKKITVRFAVIACFAMGLGAVLTPVGEPLSTILVAKLSGSPYNAGFSFPFTVFSVYVIPGVFILSLFAAFYLGKNVDLSSDVHKIEYSETLKSIIVRAVKVYVFVAALILLGEGLKPLVVWYFKYAPVWALYVLNIVSAVLDNATLTAIEISPSLSMPQITSITMSLLIAGGMLIPGNIPNIVTAARLKIKMKEWAIIGVPMGLVILAVYFIVLIPLIF